MRDERRREGDERRGRRLAPSRGEKRGANSHRTKEVMGTERAPGREERVRHEVRAPKRRERKERWNTLAPNNKETSEREKLSVVQRGSKQNEMKT